MKRLKSLPAIALIALVCMSSSCASTKIKQESVKLVRDCTGTYLRFNEKDYKVCNLNKVSDYSDGQMVTASFRKSDQCTDKSQPDMVCMMYHENEGWIQVTDIAAK